MICRLCLCEMKGLVPIFDESGCYAESQISKLIVKYLHLELQVDDVISNKICDACWNHLDDFHQFWQLIEKKQQNLLNFFKDGLVHEPGCKESRPEMIMTHIENSVTENQTLGKVQDVVPMMSLPGQEKNVAIYEKLTDAILDVTPSQILNEFGITVSENKIVKEDTIAGKVQIISEDKTLSGSAVYKKDGTVICDEVKADHESKTVLTSAALTAKNFSAKKMKSEKIISISNIERDNFIAKNLQLKCDICEVPLEKFADLRVHFKKCHNIRPYVISCCGARIYSANELYEHIQWHLNPEYFKCEDCGQILQNRKSLNKHKRTNKRHKNKDEDYKCELCEKTFAHSYLQSHMRIFHSEDNFVCKYCNKSFKIQERLSKHIGAMHENVISHVCDVCGKAFRYKPVFDIHVLEHRGMVPAVQCGVCGEWRKNKRILNLHMTLHSKINVKCKYCERECSSQLSLRRHIRYMHRLKLIWQCKLCEKSFKTERILKEHEATHTGAKLYNCQHCCHNSRSRSNMYVHVKNQHPKEWLTAQLARKINKPSNAEGTTNV